MNLTFLFVFALLVLMIFAIVGNSSPVGLANINGRFNELTCPLPIYNGVEHFFNINGTISYGNITYGDGFGSQFICESDASITPSTTTVSVAAWQYNATSFSAFPSGWFVYAGHTLQAVAQKVGAFFSLIAYVLTPINFSVLGFTIDDLSGFALMFVIGVYIFCYIAIGAFIYKAASPFSSVG